ncbi:MAG: class I SAM-dependent DNA methyltransferase [Cyanomargarita calcarea GSE-NOS-MK-12-04C]|jgi:hypothetical protein|uniref:site-specific DNA-methyltransferase (adenine-specific) n=1 Tax=Cyanomargarita calcarea GSE-NOS-MK-12-04C TaxID=2839659 RepID=A0A951QPZ8_9CYAN|nr:class I SAM-dependent DNA methyltransferase [Cyanomargarita calcarea GSE-NOS-MK-12-04C]
MAKNLEIQAHKEWLGFLQPVGLVVSPTALVAAQASVNRNVVELQQQLLANVGTLSLNQYVASDPLSISDFRAFTVDILGWETTDLVDSPEVLEELAVSLPEYGEVLRPTYAVPDDNNGWLMLLQVINPGTNFDELDNKNSRNTGWHATPQAKFERLLREKEIPIGIICNGIEIRLVYAPRGESSGHLTFPVPAMCEVSGRLILGAMHMLLECDRVFGTLPSRRLAALLQNSRKHQNEVSTKLSEQVLDALWELLRGFQTANDKVDGRLLNDIAQTEPQHIYGGLITVLLRLVFLLYAEDEGLMPQDSIYTRNYSVTGLYERLREDAGKYPDTMEQRYGAWAWLLSLFRLVYDGGCHGGLYLPARHGQLFDPDEYTFLEGRSTPPQPSPQAGRELEIEPPHISDGVIYHVLQRLLVLDAERLSYRCLDVEDIGSVYEAIMGYEVKQATSLSIGVWSKPKSAKASVTVVVSVDEVLKNKPADRAKYLKEFAGCEITGKSLNEFKQAKTAEDLIAALGRKISQQTPNIMAVGSLYLQPGEERRRSGSHYTPRALTEPIVKETLRPVLEALGEFPTQSQILNLKVCDLAVGSGAFLVEACRQLADKLVEVWDRPHPNPPLTQGREYDIPSDEEPLLYARRLVAQRCLYGVDKNPFAITLAKLSLWLVTLAKKHPFTFLDHALKCGDSLVGLTRDQLVKFNWERDTTYDDPELPLFNENFNKIKFNRDNIQNLDEDNYEAKREFYHAAEELLVNARLKGDLVIASFFAADKDKARKDERNALWLKFQKWQKNKDDNLEVVRISQELRQAEKPVKVFNWELEFPEVFDRENPGFDAIVGNPPFAGKNTAINAHADGYMDWLKVVNPESHGNSDLVAHFFRRAFVLLRKSGSFGLIATNTIGQGDTRSTGLRYICENGGTIYNARKRLKWPGLAAVTISIIHVFKGQYIGGKCLDNKEVDFISAFLFHAGVNKDPKVLLANGDKSFQGSIILGMGFTFDDDKPDATPLLKMQNLITENPKNAAIIFPYIGGDEVNSSPTHTHRRYVINFGDMSEEEANKYPELMNILEEKVKPKRLLDKRASYRKYWWQYAEKRGKLFQAISQANRVLVTNAQASVHLSFIFYSPNVVFANSLNIFPFQTYSTFTVLQSGIHEIWARFFSSTIQEGLRYNPSDCFETFPFPENWETNPSLEAIGNSYYEYRAALMVRNNEGLTDTYNRFHDPDEQDPEILKLRELHTAMDRAVLDAYGWSDISTDCDFILDYVDADEDQETEGSKRQKKKPWRYRWCEEVHDEVLARLLELNQQRAEAEILRGKVAEAKSKPKSTKPKKAKKDTATIPGLAE